MTNEEIRQKQIEKESYDLAAAQRINEFLQDPAIAGFLHAQQQIAYAQFLKADTDEKRRNAWATANALEKLKQGVNATQQNGIQAAHSRALREAQDAARDRASKRK